MRKMTNGTTTITVTAHIILKNFWEYYVTDDKWTDDIVRCLVLGAEDEIGDVSLDEIAPYKLCQTENLGEVAPAPGWSWVK